MSATNATTNYNFPVFIGTDKPAWLVDWNSAMSAIDAAIKGVDTDVQGAIVDISGLSSTVAAHTSSISTISGQITVITTNLNTATGNINTINSLIGNGTPTTTDQTLIGAINELHANQGDLADLTTPAVSLVAAINAITGGGGAVAASAVSFDPTGTSLVSVNVQAAIVELLGKIPANAAAVSYDNTASGLQATTVQAAIDEVASASGHKTLRATAPANNTYASQLGTLNTTFATLTEAEKREAYIKIGDQVFQCMGTNGVFTRVSSSSTSGLIRTLSLVNNQFLTTSIASTNASADESTTSNTSTMELYA